MGQGPSCHETEIFDTSLDDWYGSKYGCNQQSSDEWGDENDQNNDNYSLDEENSITKGGYEKDVKGLESKRSYDKEYDPLVETTAAVFHMNMSEKRDDWDDDASVTERSATVFDHLEKEAREGNHEPVVKILETAANVAGVLKASFSQASEQSADILQMLSDGNMIENGQQAAIFGLLDKVRSVDEDHVNQFSSTVFKMLEEAKSLGVQPVEERKLNIFRMLEVTKPERPTLLPSPEDDYYYGSADDDREDYPEVKTKYLPPTYNKQDSFGFDESSIIDNISEAGKTRSIPIQTIAGDSIDLLFVQDFDDAFNDFIGQNPKFLRKSPDLVHNIRVAKLQSLLAFLSVKEHLHLDDVKKADAVKKSMEDGYKARLREAIRGKAARQIYFKAELEKIALVSETLEAKLKWTTVALAEARVKRHQIMKHKYAIEKPDETCKEVIDRIPKDIAGLHLISMLQDDDELPELNETEKSEAIRKKQLDVALLTSEMKIWQRKMELLEKQTQNVSWIESVLHKISEKQMKKLKSKFQKKVGVQFD